MSSSKLMGRHAAGNGFLRAAVAERRGEPLWAYTPHERSAAIFARMVREFDRSAETRWAPADRLDLIARLGTLYLPEPSLCAAAQLRLRAGPASYSICGVTHTTASHGAMEAITGLVTAPVMPWDALVCTSQAVSATIAMLIERENEYLRWRFGQPLRSTLPQLPVIPLGVHTADFQFTPAERAAARRALEIGEEEVVALFLGRLSFHAKAHPHPMYLGLQRTAERTAKKITLIHVWTAPVRQENW